MKLIALVLLLAALGGCAPLIIGTAAGLALAHHENHRNFCIYHYGNPDCWGRPRR